MVAQTVIPQFFLFLCLASAVWTQEDNPFLVQQKQFQEQKKQRIELQKIQQGQQYLQPEQPQQRSWKPRNKPSPPRAPAANPFSKQGGNPQNRPSDGDGSAKNRNEMHKGRAKGGVGPTPWTRWTPKPKQGGNPWEGHKGSHGNMDTCGGRRYNAREHICCENSVQKRQGLRPACCGSSSFDLVFSLCCDGEVTERTAARPFC